MNIKRALFGDFTKILNGYLERVKPPLLRKQTPMTQPRSSVLILGAKGRLGQIATQAFLQDGWQVRAFARSWPEGNDHPNLHCLTGDALDSAQLNAAAKGCDVILHALNLPYAQWHKGLAPLTRNVIETGLASGATVMIPGNTYNFGAAMPAVLQETTPQRPTTRKGLLRLEMEQAFQAATAQGLRTIILRSSDFMQAEQTGNWFDTHMTGKLAKGRLSYPGPLDRKHSWAYVPDLARLFVMLAAKRHDFAPFETFGFAGFALTGRELAQALETQMDQALTINAIPWAALRLAGPVNPMMREIIEMRYLWQVSHTIDGSKLARALPAFRPTPLPEALAQILAQRGLRSAATPAPTPAPAQGRHIAV
jgi:nucleoside-diphosphate-sugar epimerase